MNIKDNPYYQTATGEIKDCVDDVMRSAESRLNQAYNQQLRAQQAADADGVLNGSRNLADTVAAYWLELGKANYYFLRKLGYDKEAFAIQDAYKAKGLRINYY